MLGVRREGVTEAAGKLQDDGLIHYSRGHINVLDRPGLESRACECHQVVKKEFDRLLPDATATQILEPPLHADYPVASRREMHVAASHPLDKIARFMPSCQMK